VKNPVILFRSDVDTKEELEIAKQVFPVTDSRVGLQERLVIARYSALPYYRELEKDLLAQGSRLVNSLREHNYIASFDYYYDVVDFTPKSWFRLQDVPKSGGPYILKGRTNSRKFDWNTMMFAKDWDACSAVYSRLMRDPLIGTQGIVIREYADLKKLEIGLNDLPFSNEWRLFYYGKERLTYGFYWTISEEIGTMTPEGLAFADQCAEIVSQSASFFVLDIAEKTDGSWTLIEVNDGQMSGLSACPPLELYESLRRLLK